MKIVNSAISGTKKSALEQQRKFKKRYGKGHRVTIKKNKTSKRLQKSSPGRFGPFWYAVNVWKL